MNSSKAIKWQLHPFNNRRLALLCGPCDQHIKQLEQHFNVTIHLRSNQFQISGDSQSANRARVLLEKLYAETKVNKALTPQQVHLILSEETPSNYPETAKQSMTKKTIKLHHTTVQTRTDGQDAYLDNIRRHNINFGIGPAGTGKTFLAVACAIEALESAQVQRLLFIRPAVEAGEKLGFLPGDLEEKVLPYLRPIYDSLYELVGFENAERLIEKNIIEIAPLAFMRGRTLNDAFIILDEAQNTTPQQMKMFLTRIGFGSTAVITGDVTQVDLPRGEHSGLSHAQAIVGHLDNISTTNFTAKDAVRHPLVRAIIEAYDGDESC